MAARFGRARCRPRNLRRGPQLESCLARSLEMGVIVVRYARVCDGNTCGLCDRNIRTRKGRTDRRQTRGGLGTRILHVAESTSSNASGLDLGAPSHLTTWLGYTSVRG